MQQQPPPGFCGFVAPDEVGLVPPPEPIVVPPPAVRAMVDGSGVAELQRQRVDERLRQWQYNDTTQREEDEGKRW